MPVVNLRTTRCDVRIDRKTRWGNPFVMGRDGNRDDVCEKYRAWLWREINNGKISLEDLADLKGKTLGCHCAPERCHGETLSAAADWAYAQLERRRSKDQTIPKNQQG